MDKLHLALICIGAAHAIGFAGLGAGIGMGHGLNGACAGVARNPEAKGAITTTMILGMALVESIAIYGLVIAFILLYANPFKAAMGI
ncbi:MAG: ATP synthase F0 subunit C [Desulfobulbaceae bacterium A2]|nr:MAG: ATP synthase F0 subunit C [Desulfobulbaceae bacterium A2]OQX17811.1 MAG: ATP synthase F0 subunit C [Desulfobulbaceae bacterium A2]